MWCCLTRRTRIGELQRKSVANQVLTQMQADLEGPDAELVKHARVEVWTFSDGTTNAYQVGDVQLSLSSVLSMLQSGPPAKWDHLYKNAEVVKKQHARFYASVRDNVESSLRFPEAKQSPVIEALYGIGAQVFCGRLRWSTAESGCWSSPISCKTRGP